MKLQKCSGHIHYVILALLVLAAGAIGWIAFQRITKHNAANSSASTAIHGTRDINYGPSTLDIYKPKDDATNYPLVVMVHGGGWRHGDKSKTASEAQDFADAGYVALNINYPTDSATVKGQPMEQQAVITAVDWAIAHKTELNINTANIALIGGSAGAHLVLMAGMVANKATPGKVKVVVELSGPTDLLAARDSLREAAATPASADSEDFQNGASQDISWFLGCDINSCADDLLKQASPRYNIDAATCPVIDILHSSGEGQPEEIATDFNTALQAAGCTSKLQIIQGDFHAFAMWPKVKDGTIKWMNSYLEN